MAGPARARLSLGEIEADLLQRRACAEAESWAGEIEGIGQTLRFLSDAQRICLPRQHWQPNQRPVSLFARVESSSLCWRHPNMELPPSNVESTAVTCVVDRFPCTEDADV